MSAPFGATVEEFEWPVPDFSVARLYRKTPPAFPIEDLGQNWARWVREAALAAAAPPDYVAMPLLTSASVLIGNARWPQGGPGWIEPPHLWTGVVGDSGDGKSPGGDCLRRHVLPPIEKRMIGDFDDQLIKWAVDHEMAKADFEIWKSEMKKAKKEGGQSPTQPVAFNEDEPKSPCLMAQDITIENLSLLLATSAPKGVMVFRDELIGWMFGMRSYNASGREFWLEAYGGRPYRVGRQKYKKPINIPRLAVGVCGGTQPSKLELPMKDPDDGLLARFLWSWPQFAEFKIGKAPPNVEWAINALDRLRMLQMTDGPDPEPIYVSVDAAGSEVLQEFGRRMQRDQKDASGLMRSAYGKARGHALRLSINLEFLWWCGHDGFDEPPTKLSVEAITTAVRLVDRYFVPMAASVYGDAAVLPEERKAAAIARWILKTHATEVYVRYMQREVRLPDLRKAGDIRDACDMLVDPDWLVPPPSGSNQGRARVVYRVNPRVHEIDMSPPGARDATAAAAKTRVSEPEPVAQPPSEKPAAVKTDRALKIIERQAPVPKIVLRRPGSESSLEGRKGNGDEAPREEARSVTPPNGETPENKPQLSALEQAIVDYDREMPGISIATIAKTFGQSKAAVAALLGRKE